MSETPHVVAIFGPTGVGKTAVALALADALRARGEDPVAISADALQVYSGLEVLTGAATPEERVRLEHRLIGFVDPSEVFSVGEFMPLAHAEIDAALADGRRPVVVGGTGLYLRASVSVLSLAQSSWSEGGVPIVVDGKLIGAIGASGGTQPQDGQVAKAGADAVK